MKHKTSEIYKILKTIRVKDLFKRSDVIHTREHRHHSDSREELLGISPTLLWRLEERDLIVEETSGYWFTRWGLSVLDMYETAVKKYGKSNVEIEVANVNNKITYDVKINPKVLKIGQPTPKKEEPEEIISKKESPKDKSISDYF